MAPRKPSAPPTPRALSADQMRQGIDRLRKRISELEAFEPGSVQDRWSPATRAIETAIEETLAKVFGEGTPAYNRYDSAATLDNGPLIIGGRPDSAHEVQEWLHASKAKSLALLNQAVKGLEEDLADAGQTVSSSSRPVQARSTNNDEVFIVHGRDSPAKLEVARLIERAGLKVVILHEQPNQGRTIIEKFEAHGGAAGFAVIVVTPDDVGGLDKDQLQPRARQNVIGEMFWFAGRLGRDRVCALKKGDIEMPSDFAGVGYTEMDDRGAWKHELLRELQAAGYNNLNWGQALA
jgi:predicted nucleotide-binding protein